MSHIARVRVKKDGRRVSRWLALKAEIDPVAWVVAELDAEDAAPGIGEGGFEREHVHARRDRELRERNPEAALNHRTRLYRRGVRPGPHVHDETKRRRRDHLRERERGIRNDLRLRPRPQARRPAI